MESQPRRKFLSRLTGAVLALGAAVTGWPLLRALVPNVLYEPPQKFKVGSPDDFQAGVTFLDERRVYLFRDGNGYFAISGVCTHLGCTVKFAQFSRPELKTIRDQEFEAFGEFHCPCHGSRFHGDGTNYAGPAPRPLAWHALELAPEDGQLVVDLGTEVDRDFRLVV